MPVLAGGPVSLESFHHEAYLEEAWAVDWEVGRRCQNRGGIGQFTVVLLL